MVQLTTTDPAGINNEIRRPPSVETAAPAVGTSMPAINSAQKDDFRRDFAGGDAELASSVITTAATSATLIAQAAPGPVPVGGSNNIIQFPRSVAPGSPPVELPANVIRMPRVAPQLVPPPAPAAPPSALANSLAVMGKVGAAAAVGAGIGYFTRNIQLPDPETGKPLPSFGAILDGVVDRAYGTDQQSINARVEQMVQARSTALTVQDVQLATNNLKGVAQLVSNAKEGRFSDPAQTEQYLKTVVAHSNLVEQRGGQPYFPEKQAEAVSNFIALQKEAPNIQTYTKGVQDLVTYAAQGRFYDPQTQNNFLNNAELLSNKVADLGGQPFFDKQARTQVAEFIELRRDYSTQEKLVKTVQHSLNEATQGRFEDKNKENSLLNDLQLVSDRLERRGGQGVFNQQTRAETAGVIDRWRDYYEAQGYVKGIDLIMSGAEKGVFSDRNQVNEYFNKAELHSNKIEDKGGQPFFNREMRAEATRRLDTLRQKSESSHQDNQPNPKSVPDPVGDPLVERAPLRQSPTLPNPDPGKQQREDLEQRRLKPSPVNPNETRAATTGQGPAADPVIRGSGAEDGLINDATIAQDLTIHTKEANPDASLGDVLNWHARRTGMSATLRQNGHDYIAHGFSTSSFSATEVRERHLGQTLGQETLADTIQVELTKKLAALPPEAFRPENREATLATLVDSLSPALHAEGKAASVIINGKNDIIRLSKVHEPEVVAQFFESTMVLGWNGLGIGADNNLSEQFKGEWSRAVADTVSAIRSGSGVAESFDRLEELARRENRIDPRSLETFVENYVNNLEHVARANNIEPSELAKIMYSSDWSSYATPAMQEILRLRAFPK